MKQDLVIIGFGMASHRLLQSLVAAGHNWNITVIGSEPDPAYNRILLSPVLAGEMTSEDLYLSPLDWYRRNGIRLHLGDGVATLERDNRVAVTEQGRRFPYDRVVFATGSRPARPGFEGDNRPGVVGLRNLADTHWLLEQTHTQRHAVVLGGGFLGLEAAEGLRRQGMQVSLVHRGHYLLNRQLDATAGQLLGQTLSKRGLDLYLENGITRVLGKDPIRQVALHDGTLLDADLVVVAAGITPNREVAEYAGLACERGILVDDQLLTSDPAIHALGECCQFGDRTYGLVEPVNQQADVLAGRLCGADTVYEDKAVATRLKISGINVYSCGELDSRHPGIESIVYHDRHSGEYRNLLLEDNRLVGAILYGDTSAGPWLFEHLQQGTDLEPWRAQLAFGEAYCEAA